MPKFKAAILIFLLFGTSSTLFSSGIVNFLHVGFGECGALRFWNAKSYLYFPDIGVTLGIKATKRISLTFDYEHNHILPFETKDNVRQYEIFYNDFFLTSIVQVYKQYFIQVGLGICSSRSYLKFLEDDYLSWTPSDSIPFKKGEIVDMYDFPQIAAKISFLMVLPVLNNRFSLYVKLKGKTGPLGAMVGSYIPSSPHIPFYLSSGLSFSLFP